MVKRVSNILLVKNMLKNKTFMYVSSKNECHRRDFDETKYISFLIKSDNVLEKYNEI